MSRIIIVVLLAGLLGLAGRAGNSVSDFGNADKTAADVTFGGAWNNNCGICNFDDNSAATYQTTLGDMYNGTSFSDDLFVLDALISTELGEPSGLAGADFNALYIWYDDDADDLT